MQWTQVLWTFFTPLSLWILLPHLPFAWGHISGGHKKYAPPPPPRLDDHDDDHDMEFEAGACTLSVSPTLITGLRVGAFGYAALNATCWLRRFYNQPGLLMFSVSTSDPLVASPAAEPHKHKHAGRPACAGDLFCYRYFYMADEAEGFYIESNQVGRAKFTATLSLWNTSDREELLMNASFGSISHKRIDSVSLRVVTLRRPNLFHRVFDWSVLALVCVIAFTVGGRTTIVGFKQMIREPKALILTLICQHIALPLITFGLLHAIPLSLDHKIGLFILVTVSGGGVAHLSVQMLKGNRDLSTTIAVVNSVLNLGFTTSWLFLLNGYYGVNVRIIYIFLWLLPGAASHVSGLLLRRFCPTVTKALLNWFTQPFLLLSAILFITLGVYLNDYAFHVVREMMVASVLILLFSGVFLGGAVGILSRQPQDIYRTMALHGADYNGLLVIVALKHAITQPMADLAASVALWGCVLTPVPAVTYVILHKAKKWTLSFIEKRKEKQVRNYYSIISNMDKLAQGVSEISTSITGNNETCTTSMGQQPRLSGISIIGGSSSMGGGKRGSTRSGADDTEKTNSCNKEVLATIETITTV